MDFWLSGNDTAVQKAGDGGVSANGAGGGDDAVVAAAAAAVPTVKVSAAEVVLTSEEEDHMPREAEEVSASWLCFAVA